MIRSERIAATFKQPFPGAVQPSGPAFGRPKDKLRGTEPGIPRNTCREAAHYFERCQIFGASRLSCARSRIAFHGVYPWAGQRPDPRASLRCRRPGKGGGNAAPSSSDEALSRHAGLDDLGPERDAERDRLVVEVVFGVVDALGVAVAEEDEGARPALQHV